jgi:DNA-binding NtrC family response regulator
VKEGVYPTVLVVTEKTSLLETISYRLDQYHCNVLEAGNVSNAICHVITHSRPIHVLLADIATVDPTGARVLTRYRPTMQVVLVTMDGHASDAEALGVEAAIAKTRELIHREKAFSAAAGA